MAQIPTRAGGRDVVLASAYLPGDEGTAPTKEVSNLVSYCQRRNIGWIIGCDANAHHTVWGSSGINNRGECLLEYICSNNICIANVGDEPTFQNSVRGEVLDLTLCSSNMAHAITNWRVADAVSLSDHNYLCFDIDCTLTRNFEYRNPRHTDWDLFRHHLAQRGNVSAGMLYSSQDIDFEAETLRSNIEEAFERSCQLRVRRPKRDVPWWHNGLERLRANTRRLFNRAKRTGEWADYRASLTEYNREIRRSKRSTWRKFCGEIDNLPEAIRLQKVLARDHSNGICTLKRPDGTYTETPEETCELLLRTHFPGSLPMLSTRMSYSAPSCGRRNMRLARRIFGLERVKWAIMGFAPYKSPGPDGIFPCLLQQGCDYISSQLSRIFISSLLLCHVPMAWREVKVVFIPKAGGRSAQLPGSYRPISLSSFFLKTMERLLDSYIRETYLVIRPIHPFQFAYQPGKSTVTAIHHITRMIEKSLGAKQVALCAFVDIQGAFDNTSYDAIMWALDRKRVPAILRSWVREMLASRVIGLNLGGSSTTIIATRGCPQGGVLSPLLWTLVVDELLEKLNDLGLRTFGYADDLVISVVGWDDSTISAQMQSALNLTLDWCKERGLNINPEKTVIVPFTRRRALRLTEPVLGGSVIKFSDEVKYLGVILDKTLTWGKHLSYITNRAIRAHYACQRLYGKTWGLGPRMIYWSFVMVIRPIITYAALAWWPRTERETARVLLGRVYRLICVSITGAMRTCPTLAIGAILHIPPLHVSVVEEACKSALRLPNISGFKSGDMVGHMGILRLFGDNPLIGVSDSLVPRRVLERNFAVLIPDRNMWLDETWYRNDADQVWFTDGSKQPGGETGAGVVGPNFQRALPMGQHPSIFQAEVYAILICTMECLRRKLRGLRIFVMSDSQAALRALSSYEVRSGIVLDCLTSLNELGVHNKVTLCWIPGHEGHSGNERADCLANRGARRVFIGPEPFFGVPTGYLRGRIGSWAREEFARIWRNASGMRQAKKFVSVSPDRSRRLLSLGKGELRVLTGLFTGHCGLRYHQSILGNVDDARCRFCAEHAETSEHVLCECPAISSRRLKHLGDVMMSPGEVFLLSPSRIIGFVRSLNLTW